MSAIRTILWIGRAERFPAKVADAPLLDVLFERDVESAAALPLASFDACVVDAPEPGAALDALRRLHTRGECPPVLVRLDRGAEQAAALARAGAAEVVLRPRHPQRRAARRPALRRGQLRGLPRYAPRERALRPLARVVHERRPLATRSVLIELPGAR